MAKFYDYSLAVWLCLDAPADDQELLAELLEHIEVELPVASFKVVDDAKPDGANKLTISLEFQLTFNESEMEDREPTGDTIFKLREELKSHLETKYRVTYLSLLDDAPTSYLIGEREVPAE